MRGRLASVVVVSVLCSACVAVAQTKAAQNKLQRYHARLVVNATSDETYEYNRDQGKEHQHSKGTAHFDMQYSQNYAMTIQSGFVELSHAEGPASSSVSGNVSTDTENQSDPDPKQSFTEAFGSRPQSGNSSDEGTGSATAIVIQSFNTRGGGLAIRVAMDGQLKGKCTASLPPGNFCLGNAFQYGGESPGENKSAHTDAAPMVMNFKFGFDFYGKPEAGSSSPTCDNCFTGGDVQGGMNNNYVFSGSGTKSSDSGGWKRSWRVTVHAQNVILG